MDTLVIGLDGGEWDVINPLIREGELPNIAQLKQEGISGPLESVTPPVSPPAWNSIQTGTNPGKHGIFDFTTFENDYTRRSTNSSERGAAPFWEVLNDEGTTTGLFKIPFTYPPDNVDGFMITGFPTPRIVDDYATPESLVERIGPVESLFEDKSLIRNGEVEEFKRNLLQVAERQTDLFLNLLREYDTQFSMMVYDGSDRIQHFFWKYFDESHPRYNPDSSLVGAIEEYYKTVDHEIGRLLNEVDEDCDVVILSDHGFGPLSSDIYIDEWLEEEGFLTRGSVSGQKVTANLLATTFDVGWEAIKRANLARAVKSMLPSSWFEFGSNLQVQSHHDVVWEDTKAFFTALSGQALYVNVSDRFMKGTVPRERYNEVIEELRESLVSIRHPESGEKLVKDVIRSDEEFEGWNLHRAPDLIVRTVPECTLRGGHSDSLLKSSTQKAQDRSGDHRKDGIFIANGRSFATGTAPSLSVLDIAPMLLYLHDCPIPVTIDGSVIEDVFSSTIVDKKDVQTTDQYGQSESSGRQWSEEEEKELEQRLNDMGYLG